MKLILTIKNQNNIEIQLKKGKGVIGQESLTMGQNLDNMLITAIDKLLLRSNIDRLSLQSLEIQGKMRPEAVSSMVIKTVKSGLES